MKNINKEIVVRKTIHDDFEEFFCRDSRTSKTLLKNYRWHLYNKEENIHFPSLSRITIIVFLWFSWKDVSEKQSRVISSAYFFCPSQSFCFISKDCFPFLDSKIDNLFVIADRQEWHPKWCLCKRRGTSRRWIGELSVATSALRNVNLLLLLLVLPTSSGETRQGHGPRKTRCKLVTRRRRRSQSRRWFYYFSEKQNIPSVKLNERKPLKETKQVKRPR